jgi:hypothetical protein
MKLLRDPENAGNMSLYIPEGITSDPKKLLNSI